MKSITQDNTSKKGNKQAKIERIYWNAAERRFVHIDRWVQKNDKMDNNRPSGAKLSYRSPSATPLSPIYGRCDAGHS